VEWSRDSRSDSGHVLHFLRESADVARDAAKSLMAEDLRVEHHPKIVRGLLHVLQVPIDRRMRFRYKPPYIPPATKA
jgi:hypothetical protein